MTKQPLFKQNPDDAEGGYLLSPAAVLLLVGTMAHEPDGEISGQGRRNALDALARLLGAARAGGFTQGQVLETMFANGEISRRVKALAQAAVDAAGADAMAAILTDLKRGNQND